MKKIAFVTCSTKPDFTADDLLAVKQLENQNCRVQAIPWDGNFTQWASFDKVVLRSCWNYHLHPTEFMQWLNLLEKQNVNLFNPISTVRWNLHKKYLNELALQGVILPPTVWLKKDSSTNLAMLLKEKKWEKAVVKPAISATAHQTFTTTVGEAIHQQNIFENMLQQGDLLVQCFMPEVQTHGEWSLIFFNKNFSHAVLKKPKANDFRVQNDFGGSVEKKNPPAWVIQKAEKILSLISESLLYTRVDGLLSGEQFLLMELELIEPVLFFSYNKAAVQKFTEAIL